MSYKIYLYVIFTFLSIYALSGINFNGMFKQNKNLEARVLVMIIAFSFGYLLTNFVVDFINALH